MPRKDLIRLRAGTTSQWDAADAASVTDPTRLLAANEQGYDTTAKVYKIGDGVTKFANLPGFLTETGLSAMRIIATAAKLPTANLRSAHRAGGGGVAGPYYAPDGAIASGRVAISLGYDIVDCDYQLTQDGVPVVMHDTTWDRTTDGTGTVASTPFVLAPNLDMREVVGSGWAPEHVPTLEEWISEFGGRVVLTIETKGGATDVPFLANIIKGKGFEQSIFVNCPVTDTAAMDAIVGAGLLLHVYGCTTTAHIATADAHGAWLVEVPYNASTTIVNAALAATNIKRVIGAPINTRVQRDALTAGLHGYVSDALGYLERTPDRRDIVSELAAQKVGPGWKTNAVPSTNLPIFDANGLVLSKESPANRRDLMVGSLAGTKPATYTISTTIKYGAWVADTNGRMVLRGCCPSDEGTGGDADTRGYAYTLRKNGKIQIWSAPVGYGAGTEITTIIGGMTTPALSDAGQTVSVDFAVTSTTVAVTRTDVAAAVLSGAVAAGTITALPVNALPAQIVTGTRLRLPNGQYATLSGTAAAGATSINVSSLAVTSTLASGASCCFSTGPIANTDWRGNYLWVGGVSSASQNRDMWCTAVNWA